MDKTQPEECAAGHALQVGQFVYVTKYALTIGIEHKRVTHLSDMPYVYVATDSNESLFDSYQCQLGNNVFVTRREAVARVQCMIGRKLLSLEKQKNKLLALREELGHA